MIYQLFINQHDTWECYSNLYPICCIIRWLDGFRPVLLHNTLTNPNQEFARILVWDSNNVLLDRFGIRDCNVNTKREPAHSCWWHDVDVKNSAPTGAHIISHDPSTVGGDFGSPACRWHAALRTPGMVPLIQTQCSSPTPAHISLGPAMSFVKNMLSLQLSPKGEVHPVCFLFRFAEAPKPSLSDCSKLQKTPCTSRGAKRQGSVCQNWVLPSYPFFLEAKLH